MALSTRKRNKILAEWKAGKFDNASQVSKHYKIDYKTAKKIIHGVPQENSHITEALEIVEKAKKSVKNPIEIQAIEQTVKERISTIEIDNELVANNRKIAKLIQAKIVANKDEIDLRTIKNVTGAIKDIEAIANPKDNGKIEVNTQVNTQINEIKVTFE